MWKLIFLIKWRKTPQMSITDLRNLLQVFLTRQRLLISNLLIIIQMSTIKLRNFLQVFLTRQRLLISNLLTTKN